MLLKDIVITFSDVYIDHAMYLCKQVFEIDGFLAKITSTMFTFKMWCFWNDYSAYDVIHTLTHTVQFTLSQSMNNRVT